MQIFNYAFNLGGDFSVKMEGMSDAMGEFNANIRATQQGIGKMTQALATFNITKDFFSNISEAFVGITEAGASAELQMMNLKTLFGGNAEAANDMYERISEYGKVTPYDKAGLLEAQRTMMSFGMSGESAFSTLQQIGDIAMGDSQKLQSLALAFGQVSSTGKLTGQDLMQMINAGFNPLNEISKATGKSVSELKEDMSKGAISVEMVSEAFRRATSEGGLFHGAIEAASETASGKLASIRDSIEDIKVSIFNATGEFGLWATIFGELMVPLSQLMPVIMGIGKAMQWVNGLQWGSMWTRVSERIKTAIAEITSVEKQTDVVMESEIASSKINSDNILEVNFNGMKNSSIYSFEPEVARSVKIWQPFLKNFMISNIVSMQGEQSNGFIPLQFSNLDKKSAIRNIIITDRVLKQEDLSFENPIGGTLSLIKDNYIIYRQNKNTQKIKLSKEGENDEELRYIKKINTLQNEIKRIESSFGQRVEEIMEELLE